MGFERFLVQQCFLARLEKWKKSVNNSKLFGALLTDLSKAFDCLNHELLTAKLNAYGFSLTALITYQTENKGQKKIHRIVVCWKLYLGLRKDRVLGPPFFNIVLIDLFFIIEDADIATYADDNTPYVNADNIDGVIKFLKEASEISF